MLKNVNFITPSSLWPKLRTQHIFLYKWYFHYKMRGRYVVYVDQQVQVRKRGTNSYQSKYKVLQSISNSTPIFEKLKFLSQETPRLLCNPKVHSCIQNCLSIVLTLGPMNPFHLISY